MKTIYKYKLTQECNHIETYKGAIVLSAGLDPNEVPCVWMQVDTAQELEYKCIFISGTGWNLEALFGGDINNFKYINTFQQGPFIWHVYEEIK